MILGAIIALFVVSSKNLVVRYPDKYRPLDCKELGMLYQQTIIDGELTGENCLPKNN